MRRYTHRMTAPDHHPLSLASSAIHALAGLLDERRPASVLVLSLNPLPAVAQWCAAHGASLTSLATLDPGTALTGLGRFDLVVVADQLEYMSAAQGTILLGTLRNLHSSSLAVLYQPALAPEALRWPPNAFLALGLHRAAEFQQAERHMTLYRYELDSYNFHRTWNTPEHWANPQNWGRYWW